MATPPPPTTRVPNRSRSTKRVLTPSRPTRPYISLDDPNTERLFTTRHIQNHLRRAGLLNKKGEIVTQAEYDSIHKDVAIGRENQRKIDDVVGEVVKDLSREHWAYASKYTKDVENKLRYQFGRIERQYRRRVQPITVRRSSDGEFHADTNEPKKDNHADAPDDSNRPSNTTLSHLPPINSTRPSTRRHSTDFDSIRQELTKIKDQLRNLEQAFPRNWEKTENGNSFQRIEHRMNNFERKLITIQNEQLILNRKHEEVKHRMDELFPQPQPHDSQTESPEIDKQHNQMSTVIKELNNRISMLETSARQPSTGLTQEAIDQAIKISEKKTIERENNIEKLVRGTDDRIKQLEIQLTQLSSKFDELPNSITHADVHQLIQKEIHNFIRKQSNNNEGKDLAQEAINKINIVENRLNQYIQSTGNKTSPSTITEVVPTPIAIQKSAPLSNDNFEQRLNQLENQIKNIHLPSNIELTEQHLTQLENYIRNSRAHHIPSLDNQIRVDEGNVHSLQQQFNILQQQIAELGNRKAEQQEIMPMLANLEQKTQHDIQQVYNTLLNLLNTKPDHPTVDQLIQDSKNQINEEIKQLEQFLEDNQRAIKNMEGYLNDLLRRINQQSSSKPLEDLTTEKPTPKELRALMPFIELLPTFDMFNDNEWI